MKIARNKLLGVLGMLFTCAGSFAASTDPPPPTPPPPPGLPIDGGVLILLFISVLFGLYKVYQFNLNKKTPV